MKQLHSAADLAIHGAPPAFEQTLAVGRPLIGDFNRFSEIAAGVFDSGMLANNGPVVDELERRIAEHHGVDNCVAVSSGTAGLQLALRVLGIHGDVIMPSFTFPATAQAALWLGMQPVFVDIELADHSIDPSALLDALTEDTAAILGVNLWGRMGQHRLLSDMAAEAGVPILFDAAHAFGCTDADGNGPGSVGLCSVLSFHATKVFNTFEGGAVLTNDKALAADLKQARNFGLQDRDTVSSVGTNAKLTEVAAAMGLVNLESIGDFIETNHANHDLYRAFLDEIPGVTVMPPPDQQDWNAHYVVIEVDRDAPTPRDDLMEILEAENVIARRYFWPGCHRSEMFAQSSSHAASELPNTDHALATTLLLPNGPQLGEQTVETIARVISLAMAA